jgi:ABC-type lipoprotein release transport system permease subunit
LQTSGRPSDVEGLARLRSLPVVLASLLVLVVGATVANAMVVAVRRRRRDIAILQSLGSTRGNVTAVGVWQGVTIGVSALLVGVPLGVVAGRWLWTRLANGFGTLAEPVVPLGGIGALATVVVVLAALSGLAPIRAGLRHQPAKVLRSE